MIRHIRAINLVNIFVVTKLKRNYDLSDKENIFPEDKDIPKVKVCVCNYTGSGVHGSRLERDED